MGPVGGPAPANQVDLRADLVEVGAGALHLGHGDADQAGVIVDDGAGGRDQGQQRQEEPHLVGTGSQRLTDGGRRKQTYWKSRVGEAQRKYFSLSLRVGELESFLHQILFSSSLFVRCRRCDARRLC